MNKENPVKNFMSKKVIVANLKNKISQVQELFVKHNMHHLPVVYDDRLIGIISATDLMKFYAEKAFTMGITSLEELDSKVTLEELMTHNPISVTPESTIQDVVELFYEHKFHSVLVEDKGQIVGIVTDYDVVRLLKGNFDVEDGK